VFCQNKSPFLFLINSPISFLFTFRPLYLVSGFGPRLLVGLNLKCEYVGYFSNEVEPIVFGILGRHNCAGQLLLGVESFPFCSPHRRSARTETTLVIGQHPRRCQYSSWWYHSFQYFVAFSLQARICKWFRNVLSRDSTEREPLQSYLQIVDRFLSSRCYRPSWTMESKGHIFKFNVFGTFNDFFCLHSQFYQATNCWQDHTNTSFLFLKTASPI